MTTAAIKEEVRKLQRDEQLSLIQYIVQILQEEEAFVLSDAWKAELDRREGAYLNGTETLYNRNEAKERISAKL